MHFIPNQVYTVFSFIGFIMCAIPFYWHFEAWNAGTCLLMAWTGLGCLIQCINSIVWNKNTIDRAPFYCDIIIHLQSGLNVALAACALCINRRLYKIATARAVIITKTEKRRAIMVDLLIGIGIPVLQMIIVHVVLEDRYQIFEDFGPYPSIAITPPSFFLFFAWPLAIGCVDCVYCSMTIYTFYKRNRQIRSISPDINRGRYFRLMAFTFIEMFGGIPLETYEIVFNATKGVTPWKSWANMHRHYSLIPMWPAVIWKNKPTMHHTLELARWSFVGVAFFFFAFFGFADEARQHYRLVCKWLVSRIRRLTSTRTPRGTLDVYATLLC
ncbi:GPCR fungal pheromone mating factor [Russula dissimulans]|nr:GPCR fungal pheromone mating factor [Russula dissimulans]